MNVTTFSCRATSLAQTEYENDKSKTLYFTTEFVLPELVNSTEFEAMSSEADMVKQNSSAPYCNGQDDQDGQNG